MTGSPRVLSMVLAGGEGRRLWPLTADRAKPAVPFAGHYRLIDFVLSNLVNGGYSRIFVLTQYKSHSLNRHIARAWGLGSVLGHYVATVPAQMRRGPRWFAGSADAIFQSLNLVYDDRPDYVLVFGADHIYRIDPRQLVEAHRASGAGVTVAAVRVPVAKARSFGVIEADATSRIRTFREKPSHAAGLLDAPGEIFASMGNYCFTTQVLIEEIQRDAADPSSRHDLGGDVIPSMVQRGEAAVYDFAANEIPGATPRDAGYWRDVGTLDSYYDANMDQASVHPIFNLYNEAWPIHCRNGSWPPAKFVFDDEGRRGQALDSMISAGTIVSGGTVRHCILGPRVRIHSGSVVEDSVLMEGVDIAEGATVTRAIVDKGVRIPPGARVGLDPAADRRFTISGNGIVVIGKHGWLPVDGGPSVALRRPARLPAQTGSN